MSLSKEGFLAIAAVAWADGLLRKNEAAGLLNAAQQVGLSDQDLAVVKRATEQGLTLDGVNLDALTLPERVLTYAMATWLAKVDGVVNTDELATLRELGDALALPEQHLKFAASAAFDLACLPEGHKPDKFEFAKLEAQLRQKLPTLMV
jgi:uncharacterized membrane protein YebE (DUF533 family)